MKKALLILGSIGILFVFVSSILPNLIGVPLAAYQAYKAFQTIPAAEISPYNLTTSNSDSIFKFPKPIGYVNDYANVFTAEQRVNLDEKISYYEFETTNEIAIITIDSIAPYDNISDFTTDLAKEWGIGKAEKNNGLVILFCMSLREVRISTGLGTQKILTDEICKNIIDQILIPNCKKDDYYIGIEKALAEIILKWQ